jgi:hypothetical protein
VLSVRRLVRLDVGKSREPGKPCPKWERGQKLQKIRHEAFSMRASNIKPTRQVSHWWPQNELGLTGDGMFLVLMPVRRWLG